MTSLEQAKTIALNYRWWAIGLPLSGVGGYLLDGFYFGATASKSLRNAMLLIALITLPLSTLLTHHYDNLGIWISIYLFLWLRVLLLAPDLTHRLQLLSP
ncbi:hypothetical protein [Rappaport israeli]|uniref:hypothetical protein n=1 Tax=Rappaport israeli TaxID=1839807 RepID=UPI0009304515|nr:hypothetical protein [Rappaport israeli]